MQTNPSLFPLNGEFPLFLAPMAELTHSGFRTLIHTWGGCSVYATEMISAPGLLSKGPYERFYLDFSPDPSRTIVQLVGYDMDSLVQAAGILAEHPILGVDINMGCAAPEIRKRGGGAGWLLRGEEAVRLVGEVRRLLPPHLSLSVKIRIPESLPLEEFILFLQRLAKQGLSFITVHPKGLKEKHDRPARWDLIPPLLEEIPIPVVGNGNITSLDVYRKKREELPRLAGIMIGRKAVEAPWFFAYLRSRERGGGGPFTVNLEETARSFLELLSRHQPPEFHLSRARRFFRYYTRNLFFGHTLLSELLKADSLTEMERLLSAYFERHPEEIVHEEK
ncbi:dihydrouridine synthase DuS [Spirochaeta thermophila DSM 6578]|uniref:tRNA-dihydrouridine synthase n=1 Tax=Winmispira thermophila (strain ATCC 700085 / DSM 6578 / Z-1203) TaxID=869211 RepID=G0GC15_WINT7|nr:tRNA-dihydrouridine synthase family protein [Spirochaeta thermophila]AEJ60379.1 dihydrouridine synthase DuS [Spirochaeta thermophila DSM 6578]